MALDRQLKMPFYPPSGSLRRGESHQVDGTAHATREDNGRDAILIHRCTCQVAASYRQWAALADCGGSLADVDNVDCGTEAAEGLAACKCYQAALGGCGETRSGLRELQSLQELASAAIKN